MEGKGGLRIERGGNNGKMMRRRLRMEKEEKMEGGEVWKGRDWGMGEGNN